MSYRDLAESGYCRDANQKVMAIKGIANFIFPTLKNVDKRIALLIQPHNESNVPKLSLKIPKIRLVSVKCVFKCFPFVSGRFGDPNGSPGESVCL